MFLFAHKVYDREPGKPKSDLAVINKLENARVTLVKRSEKPAELMNSLEEELAEATS